MKAVLDTNVLVSAALTTHGTCSKIIDLLVQGAFGVCANDFILEEYDTVLRRPELGIVSADAETVLELIRSVAEPVAGIPLAAALPDPKDVPFLEVAAASGAVLVTGNVRHFPPKARAGTRVMNPREFLDFLRHLP